MEATHSPQWRRRIRRRASPPMVSWIVASLGLLSSTLAFTTSQNWALLPRVARMCSNGGVMPLEPISEGPKEKQKRARDEMKKRRILESELSPSVLELISDGYQIPAAVPKRPEGRQEMVKAAMSRESAIRHEQQESIMRIIKEKNLGSIIFDTAENGKENNSPSETNGMIKNGSSLTNGVPVTNGVNGKALANGANRKSVANGKSVAIEANGKSVADGANGKLLANGGGGVNGVAVVKETKKRKGRRKGSKNKKPSAAARAAATKRKKGVKGDSDAKEDTAKKPKAKRRRKRVKKNLPKARRRDNENEGTWHSWDSDLGLPELNGIQTYYQTKLLTAKQEYSCGIMVNLMIRCEEVHDALGRKLGRLPTIQEWGSACGYNVTDPNFVQTEEHDQLRPEDYKDLFKVVEHPGRGRRRVKKTFSSELIDFFDDTENRFRSPNDQLDLQPINRGTTTQFVRVILSGRSAKQRMIQGNMRLVVSIAKKYSHVDVPLHDLVQEGSIGLTRATEKFEPQRGFKFSTYASWWIQQAVFNSIANNSRTIRLPVHVHNLLTRVRKVRRRLESSLKRLPENEEIAEALDMPVAKYNKMMKISRRSISLENPLYSQSAKDERADTIQDSIVASGIDKPSLDNQRKVDRMFFRQDLRDMLQVLDDDERMIISARYGLEDGVIRTVAAVAAQLKQPNAWVRSVECKGLRKLRKPWYEQRLWEHRGSLFG